MGEIRIGQISSIDRAKGMAKVIYNDRDGAVTKMLPLFSFNGEYKAPEIGQYVLVVHLSNGTEAGCIMGTYWNEARPPAAPNVTWRKELGKKSGEAFLQYDSGTLQINAGNIQFKTNAGTTTMAEIIRKI